MDLAGVERQAQGVGVHVREHQDGLVGCIDDDAAEQPGCCRTSARRRCRLSQLRLVDSVWVNDIRVGECLVRFGAHGAVQVNPVRDPEY
jgi:hypothetical protein